MTKVTARIPQAVFMWALALTLWGVVPLATGRAQHPGGLTAHMQSSTGAPLGTAILVPLGMDRALVTVRLSGLAAVGGDRRMAIHSMDTCWADTGPANEVAVLPPLQLYPDGSAEYRTTVEGVPMAALAGANGSALVLHADTSVESPVIACGVLSNAQAGASSLPALPPPTPVPVPPTTQMPPAGATDTQDSEPAASPPADAQPSAPSEAGSASSSVDAAVARLSQQELGPEVRVLSLHGLRLREGPGLGERIILALNHHETVHLMGACTLADAMGWVPVVAQRGGRELQGYVAAIYLEGSPTCGVDDQAPRLQVTHPAGLLLRTGPGYQWATSRIAPQGALLEPTGREEIAQSTRWTEVRLDEAIFWTVGRHLAAE
jgi:hypothetical protein